VLWIRWSCALLAALVAAPGTSAAIPITFQFSGVVEGVSFGPDVVPLGSIVTGAYTFESSTADESPGPRAGFYPGAITKVEYSVNGHHVVYMPNSFMSQIDVSDADFSIPAGGADTYQVRGSSFSATVNGAPINDLFDTTIFLASEDDAPFSNDLLPLVAPDLADFQRTNYFTLQFQAADGRLASVDGPLFLLTPEPSTGVLLGAGLLLLGASRRRAA